MTIAEIAKRANVPTSAAVKELSRIMGQPLTEQDTISAETAGYAILILVINQVLG